MQGLLRKIGTCMLLMGSMHVYADPMDNTNDPNMPLQGYKYCWMLGFDVNDQILHPQNDFANLAFNYRIGSTVYVAWRSKGPFGLELGYHWTTDKAKNVSIVPGQTMFGATAATTANFQSKLRIEDTYIDAYWHYKIKKFAELKIGPGVGWVRENLVFYNLNTVTDPVATALETLYTATTTVARFNIGLQTMLTKRIGARALFNFQTTNSIKCRRTLPGVDPHMFANSYMFALGVFYTITGYYDDNPGPNGEFIN